MRRLIMLIAGVFLLLALLWIGLANAGTQIPLRLGFTRLESVSLAQVIVYAAILGAAAAALVMAIELVVVRVERASLSRALRRKKEEIEHLRADNEKLNERVEDLLGAEAERAADTPPEGPPSPT